MANERKLRNRKQRASKGKAIRVSNLVYNTLDKERYGKSWDSLLRRYLGLPLRSGEIQPLIEGMLEQLTGKFLLKTPGIDWHELETSAYELGFIAGAKRKVKYVPKPIRVRELP